MLVRASISASLFVLLASSMLLTTTANAVPLTIAGFGDSITCDTCNDGSYLGRIGSHLSEAPTIDDNGISSDLTENVLARFDTWLTDGNTADWVIVLAGTPDTFQAVGGFNNQAYSQSETVGNISDLLDLAIAASLPVVLVAPPATQSPCGFSSDPTCGEIETSLMNLSGALSTLAGGLGIPFVDIYNEFVSHPSFGITSPGDEDSLLRHDGLHPKYTTGDDLIASEIAAVIPEPSSALLVAAGLLVMASRNRQS